MEPKRYDVIIIGGGPGGVTAGIYCRRALMKTLLIEKGPIGGMLLVTDYIENYPGTKSLHGYELATLFEEHLKSYEPDILHTMVSELLVDNAPPKMKTVRTEKGDFIAPTVIIATGGTPRPLEVDRYQEFLGHGVSTCAVCDAAFFKNKTAAVIGGGDAAVDEAIYLSKFVKKLYLVHRRDKLKAEVILVERLLKTENIECIWDTALLKILGDQVVTGMRIKNLKTGVESEIALDGIFNYTGHRPNSSWIKAPVLTNEGGYILTDQNMETNIPGLYAVGDVRAGTYRQAVIAAGEGAMAALMAHHYFESIADGLAK